MKCRQWDMLKVKVAQVNGGQLPPHVLPYCAGAALLAACLPVAAFFLTRAEAHLREAVHHAPQVCPAHRDMHLLVMHFCCTGPSGVLLHSFAASSLWC